MDQTIGQAVVESLAWLLQFLDEAPDEEVNPDAAVRWTENATYALFRLPTQKRQELAAFCRAFAEETDSPGLREALLQFVRGSDLDHDYGT
jgi:hypothetical protein